MSPQRMQRKRVKGWRMPEGAVYVGRPSKWGNPFTVMNGHRQGWLVWDDRDRHGWVTHETSNGYIAAFDTELKAAAFAVKQYRRFIRHQWDLSELRGRDLACWCKPGAPCHADVLLNLANAAFTCLVCSEPTDTLPHPPCTDGDDDERQPY